MLRWQPLGMPRHGCSTKSCPSPLPTRPSLTQDIHSPGTTVREALVFSARLRLDESIGWDKVRPGQRCGRWWWAVDAAGSLAVQGAPQPRVDRRGPQCSPAHVVTPPREAPTPQVTAIVDNALGTVDLVGLVGSIVGEPGGPRWVGAAVIKQR